MHTHTFTYTLTHTHTPSQKQEIYFLKQYRINKISDEDLVDMKK